MSFHRSMAANKKIHDVLLALKDSYRLRVITYGDTQTSLDELEGYWGRDQIRFHIVEPNTRGATLRAIAKSR